MSLDDEIEAVRAAVFSLGPKLDREIERLRRDIRKKIEAGELSPEIVNIFRERSRL
jgi:hypothetical protein